MPIPHEMALTLLRWNNPEYYFDEIILDYEPSSQRIGSTKTNTRKNEPELVVYPNPANSYFTAKYQLTSETSPTILTIKDINGRLIKQYELNNNEFEVLINLSEYTAGIYTVSLNSGSNCIATEKLTVIK
jgi:hypothetical protein